jgi:hypothetical protein
MLWRKFVRAARGPQRAEGGGRGISDGASSAEGDGAGFGAGVDLFAVAETLGLAGRRTSQELGGELGGFARRNVIDRW